MSYKKKQIYSWNMLTMAETALISSLRVQQFKAKCCGQQVIFLSHQNKIESYIYIQFQISHVIPFI